MAARGPHINMVTGNAWWLLEQGVQTAKLVAVRDFPEPARLRRLQAQFQTFLLLRVWCDDDKALDPSPEQAAERLWRRVQPIVAQVGQEAAGAIETPWNECWQRGDELKRHAAAIVRFAELAHADGWKVAGFNFSVGNPEPWEFAEVRDAAALCDYHSFHEYWSPEHLNSPWWTGRALRCEDALPADCRRPVLITEAGVGALRHDRAGNEFVDSIAGWRHRDCGLNEEALVRELDAYAALLDSAHSIFVFNCGDYPNGTWKFFEVDNAPAVQRWILASPPLPRLSPPPEPLPTPLPEPERTPMVRYAGFPKWNQFTDWTTDSDGVDENAANNCGPESLAMVIKWYTGIELSADFIKDALYGETYLGYTHIDKLAAFAMTRCDMQVEYRISAQDIPLQPVVRRTLDAGHAMIVLFFLRMTGAGWQDTGHFCPLTGYSEAGVWRVDPLTGKEEFLPWATFETWHKTGQYLILRAKRRPDLKGGILTA